MYIAQNCFCVSYVQAIVGLVSYEKFRPVLLRSSELVYAELQARRGRRRSELRTIPQKFQNFSIWVSYRKVVRMKN